MNFKIIIYVLALTLVSAIIGGGAVYLATNSKSRTNPTIESENSVQKESQSSSSKTINSDNAKTSSSVVKTEESIIKSEKSISKSEEEKPVGQKFTGWLGSTDIEMYLDFKQDKITGKYYNSYDKKWYKLDGNYRDNIMGQPGQSGSIELNEYDGNLITGSLLFNTQNPAKVSNQSQQNSLYQNGNNYIYGIPAGIYYTNTIKTLGGYYADKKFGNYDLFVSSEQSDIDYFVDKNIEVKVVKLDDGNPGNSTLFEQNGNYYFTFEDWKIPKDIKVGDKLRVTGKVRSFNNSQGFEIRPYSNGVDGIYESTSQGLFQIKEAVKI